MSWHTLKVAAKMLHRSTGHVRRQCRRWEKQRKAKLRRRNGRKASWMIHSSVLGETCDPVTQIAAARPAVNETGEAAARVGVQTMSIPPDAIVIIIPPGSAAAAGKLFNALNKGV